MFIGSFLIQYFIMSRIMTNIKEDITKSRGKIYMSLIMATLMCLLEIFMHDIYNFMFSWHYYLFFIALLVVLVYIYRKQLFIDDKNYLEEMIEHHSMALLTSGEIIGKTSDDKVKLLATNIIKTQEREIEQMKLLLVKKEKDYKDEEHEKKFVTVDDIEKNNKK
jgi:Ca2+/Na+ antiporter